MSQTRERLLDAVDKVLQTDGVPGLSLRKVARVAGVSHAAPGVVFGDKAGLLTEYAQQGFVAMRGRMEGALDGHSDGPAALASVGQAYIQFALDRPEQFEVMFRQDLLDANDPQYIASARDAFEPLAASLELCVDGGQVASDAASDTLVAAWSLVHGLVMLWRSKHLAGRVEPDPAELGRRVTSLFAGLLAA